MVEVRIGTKDVVFLSYEEFEERVRAGRIPVDAEIRFEPVTGDRFVVAGDLDLVRSLAEDRAVAWRARFTNSGPPVLTALLVGIQIRIWMYTGVPDAGTELTYSWMNWLSPALENGESWRVMTHGLLHTDFLHILLNNVWLAYTGWNIERALGRANLAAIFFFSVFAGGLLSLFLTPGVPSLGASGGVYGLVSASVVFGFVRQDLLPERGRQVFGVALLPYLVLMFFSGLSNASTDNWAHFGGLVCGGAMAFLVDPPGFQRRSRQNGVVQGVGTAIILLVLVVLNVFGPSLYPLLDEEQARIEALPPAARARAYLVSEMPLDELDWSVPAGWRPGANPAGDRSFRSPGAGHARSFAVVLTEHERPWTAEALADEWKANIERGHDSAIVSELPPGQGWLGREASAVRRLEARIPHEDGELLLSFVGVVQGAWTLHQVIEVEAEAADRLAPLFKRLEANVAWHEPLALQSARRTLQSTPKSVLGRRTYAWELARYGQAAEALEIQRTLVDERPGDPEVWVALLTMAGWSPELVDVPSLYDEALGAIPMPAVVRAVADGLREAGDPDGANAVLGLAWLKAPGDRKLRKAMRQAGLPWVLGHAGLPTQLSTLPDGTPRDPDAIARWQTLPFTVADARSWERVTRDERAEIEAQVPGVLDTDAVFAVLLRLRDGTVDVFPGDEHVLVRDLSALLGTRPPAWMSPDLAAVLSPAAEDLLLRIEAKEP